MKRLMVGAVALAVGMAASWSATHAQEHGERGKGGGEPDSGDPAQMMEMMKKWQELASPSVHHNFLDQFVGTWDLATKMWMQPGAPPSESTGSATVKWIMAGRFLLEDMESSFMMPDPATGELRQVHFTGMGLTGYDNYNNQYIGAWMDNMSTRLSTMSGTRDPSGKVFTYYGPADDPMRDMHSYTLKYVTRIINQDRHVFEIIDTRVDGGAKMLEVTYTRRR